MTKATEQELNSFYIQNHGIDLSKREITIKLKYSAELNLGVEETRIAFLQAIDRTARQQDAYVIDIK